MSQQNLQRRDMLKLLGAVAGVGAVAPKVLGRTARGTLVESPEEYGGFAVEKLDGTVGRTAAYLYKPDVVGPLSEKMTAFSRNMWDPARQDRPHEDFIHKRMVEGKGKIPNQTRLDYALMAASWTVARSDGPAEYRWEDPRGPAASHGLDKLGPWNPSELDMTWEDASRAVKHAALFYGASLAGVAEVRPWHIYSEIYKPTREDRERVIPVIRDTDRFGKADNAWYIPKSMNRVISIAFEEDYYGIANSPGQLASAATGNGYSRMAFTAPCLAEFIRSLGYRAIPSGNGLGPSIAVAIEAGLGELGRNGILVTPKYGPRIRLAKVYTDMPLIPDPQISFGVPEFCETCMLCADDCPSGSISKGPRTWEGKSLSNNPGFYKWYIEPDTCYDYNGFSCSNCKRVCPFTKPNNSWLHQMIRTAIHRRIKPANNMMVTLDQASGYGRQLPDTDFWKMDGSKSITARESM